MASAQPRQPVANPAQSGNPCAVARVSRVEANPQAASVLGYAPAELLALKADQIFSTGRELWQQITTDNRASSHSGGKLVTKHGRSLWPVMTAHTVVHHGRAAVLVIAGYPLKAGQLEYDCRYSKMHGMPITGGRGFRGLKPLWYNGVPP